MMDKNSQDFAVRNGLIPLCAMTGGGTRAEGLDVDVTTLCRQINAAGLRPENFYYDPAAGPTPFSYWRGVVLLEFSGAAEDIASIKTMAGRLEEDINDSVARRDFDRFLELLDPRLAPELFMEVFGLIPDQDKFRLFERLWRFNQHAHDIFPPAFAREAYQYRKVAGSRPPLDSSGHVRVFCSPAAGEEPHLAENWTTDINRALRAASTIPAAPIYRGRVHPQHIGSCHGRRRAGQVLVKPGTVQDIRSMDLIDLADFGADMGKAGIMDRYRLLAGQIDESWFQKPDGIHAVGHTRRVLILSLLLGCLEGFGPTDRDLLAWAAICHDIGRVDDGYDPGHGQASYARTCREGLVQWTNPEDSEVFRFIIENHDLPDSRAYQAVQHCRPGEMERTLRLYLTFKDADGLDRVRLGDLNPDYLRTASAPRLLLVANQLYFQPGWLERIMCPQGL